MFFFGMIMFLLMLVVVVLLLAIVLCGLKIFILIREMPVWLRIVVGVIFLVALLLSYYLTVTAGYPHHHYAY
jgi:hypothetical protein